MTYSVARDWTSRHEGEPGAGPEARAMIAPWYRVALTSAIVSLLCACSSPAQSVTFKPPAGWVATPSFFGFQAWHPSDDTQALVLFKLPVAADMNQALTESNFQQLTVKRRERIDICGRQPAIYIAGTATGRRGTQKLEMIMTTARGATYLAMYSRDLNVRANAQAETAIRTLCPRS